jgi:hypothetical protein
MDNPESASQAAAGMHGKMIEGRSLVVRLRSEGPGKGPSERPRGFGPSENDESKVQHGSPPLGLGIRSVPCQWPRTYCLSIS